MAKEYFFNDKISHTSDWPENKWHKLEGKDLRVFHLTHHLGMNFYVNFLGRVGSNGFQLI